MRAPSEKPAEFHRYRRAMTVLYLTTATLGVSLLGASVVKHLLFREPAVQLDAPALSAADPNPEDLLRCNRDVLELYTQLPATTARLLALPTAGKYVQLSTEWEQFSRQWLYRWDQVDARCRFSELADSHMGRTYDWMAKVHHDLRGMRLRYQSLLVRFDTEQSAELVRMRQALSVSQEEIENLTKTAP